MARRWVMLTDIGGGTARIMSLDEHEEQRDLLIGQLANSKIAVGLRRMILEETGTQGINYRETGEFAPMTPELHLMMSLVARPRNGWNYDWPNLQVEQDLSAEQSLREKLEGMMEAHPFEFELTGLQRRFLMYFSDGNASSQKSFLGLTNYPKTYPYNSKGELRKEFLGSIGTWGSTERDLGVTAPPTALGKPVLYIGPAWAVRFQLDKQVPLHGNCVMYVTDTGEFLCSDWCQRHDFSTYVSGSINLQLGIYTFDNWIVGPCLQNAIAVQAFTPTSVKVERVAVRELAKEEAARIATAKYTAKAQLQQFQATQNGKVPRSADPITDKVRDYAKQYPGDSREAQALGVLKLLKTAFADGDMPGACGARTWVNTYVSHGGDVGVPTKQEHGIQWFQYIIRNECGITVPVGRICFKKGGSHKHWSPYEMSDSMHFAEKETLAAINAELDKLEQQRATKAAAAAAAAIPGSPITADVMAMAEAAFQEHKQQTKLPAPVVRKDASVDLPFVPVTFVHDSRVWLAQVKPGYLELHQQKNGEFIPVGSFIRRQNGHVYSVDPETRETAVVPDSTRKRAAMFYFEHFKPVVPPFPAIGVAALLNNPLYDGDDTEDDNWTGPHWDEEDPVDNNWITEQV